MRYLGKTQYDRQLYRAAACGLMFAAIPQEGDMVRFFFLTRREALIWSESQAKRFTWQQDHKGRRYKHFEFPYLILEMRWEDSGELMIEDYPGELLGASKALREVG